MPSKAQLETRAALKDRMIEQGDWEEYVQLRTRLRDEGDPNYWRNAAEMFPPGGSPPVRAAPAAPSAPPTRAPAGKSAYASGLTLSDFKDRSEWSSNPKKQIEWVFMWWAMDDVTPDMAPSPGAWALRDAMRTNVQFRQNFYMNVYTKLLPTKGQLDDLIARMADDGRDELDLLRHFLKTFRRSDHEPDEDTDEDREAEPHTERRGSAPTHGVLDDEHPSVS